MLSFEILGGLQVRSPEGNFKVKGQCQQVLLQTLLVSGEHIVSSESLMDELWGDDVPNGVVNALQAHVSRLRKWLKAVEPYRAEPRLASHPHGYQLLMEGCRLDATVFVKTVTEATVMKDRDPGTAADMLRGALDMWRGPVFGGSSGGQKCSCAATKYEEYRMQAVESLFDAELRLGRHALILGELQDAHTSDPLRERFCAQLMLALYRSGRQADALSTYRRMRHRLTDELGVEPTRHLRQLEHAILSHAPTLSAGEPVAY